MDLLIKSKPTAFQYSDPAACFGKPSRYEQARHATANDAVFVVG
jgi:hypothetical protein